MRQSLILGPMLLLLAGALFPACSGEEGSKEESADSRTGDTVTLAKPHAPPDPRLDPERKAPKRIRFIHGEKSADVRGTIDGREPAEYVFYGAIDQDLSLQFQSSGNLAAMVITRPDGKILGEGEGDESTPLLSWQGSLPVSGRYTILVLPVDSSGSNTPVEFGIRIQVE